MLNNVPFKRTMIASMLTLMSGAVSSVNAAPATASPENAPKQDASKPNIVVIFGDDIGYWNISSYNQGMMGYKTPNIDSIANEGAKFTSYYAEQSGLTSAVCDYEGEIFSAALEYQNYFAVQFHPEKSGKAGARLLRNFIELLEVA